MGSRKLIWIIGIFGLAVVFLGVLLSANSTLNVAKHVIVSATVSPYETASGKASSIQPLLPGPATDWPDYNPGGTQPEQGSPSWAVTMDVTFKNLVAGNLQWSGPAKMTVGDMSVVGIALGTDQISAAALQASLKDMMPGTANTQTGSGPVTISPHMTATLTGDGFDISPSGSVEQVVLADAPTTWSWQIRAKEAGAPDYLTITVADILPDGQHEVTKTEDIFVAVAPQTLLEKLQNINAYLKVIGSIVAALIAILSVKPVKWAVRKLCEKFKKRDPPPPAGPVRNNPQH